ncbi:MAG: hypothetical protein K9G26_00860 [Emcibacter sp.]|nr:hypothetical protein [Emcibacter sp.]
MTLIRIIVTSVLTTLLTVFVFSMAAQAATACRAPLKPTIPNEETASKEEIIQALTSVKNDFQPAILNFQNCVATEKAAIGDVATEEQIAEWDMLYDAAYALETQVADSMNAVIRAYKERAAKQEKSE